MPPYPLNTFSRHRLDFVVFWGEGGGGGEDWRICGIVNIAYSNPLDNLNNDTNKQKVTLPFAHEFEKSYETLVPLVLYHDETLELMFHILLEKGSSRTVCKLIL